MEGEIGIKRKPGAQPGNHNKDHGSQFELRVQRFVEGSGYVVFKSPASKSPADLMCMRLSASAAPLWLVQAYNDQSIPWAWLHPDLRAKALIQCKINKATFGREERAALVEMAKRAGASPVLCSRGAAPRYPLVWEILKEEKAS